MRYCIYPDCSAKGKKGFFQIPQKDPMRSIWIEICGLENKNLSRNKYSHICIKHFREKDLNRDKDGRILLNPGTKPVNSYVHEGQKHYKFSHSTQDYKCQTCGKAFFGLWELNTHIKSFHSIKQRPVAILSKSAIEIVNASLQISNSGIGHKCKKCGKTFETLQNFDTHVKIDHEDKRDNSTLCHRRIDTFLKRLFLCHKHAKTKYYVVLACM